MTYLTSRLAIARLSFMRIVGVALVALASIAAAHAQATIADCEQISAADAYNQCLAKFGPASKAGNLKPERPGDVKGSSEEAAAGAGRPKVGMKGGGKAAMRRGRHARGGHTIRHGGGRKRMTISVRRHR